MGAAPAPDAVYQAFLGHAAERGRLSDGFHNRNYLLPLTDAVARLVGRRPGTPVVVRVRRTDAPPVVIRTWQDEPWILRAVGSVLTDVPQCLAQGDGYAIHSHVDGVPLAAVCPDGKPVEGPLLRDLAGLLARPTRVRRAALPPLPPFWPRNHTDSQGFLRTLAHLAETQIRRPNLPRFGGLFAALGIPDDAMLRLADRVPAMARRPYGLLHGDLHRGNVLTSRDGTSPLVCLDWELATYGDPLHDLAVHLVRTGYPADQYDEVVEAWADAMRPVRPAAVHGVTRDLRHYLAFERAQSVYPDIVRAARSLECPGSAGSTGSQGSPGSPEESFGQGSSLAEATATVRRALESAAGPLGLRQVPGEPEIERILFRWRASARSVEARRLGSLSGTLSGPFSVPAAVAIDWVPDERVPERADFGRSAVGDALYLEGAAPADRVFKGTAHLNTVVRVPGTDFPVVIRREVANPNRRERSFLSEHAVLAAIEKSGVAVAAPRVLALGESHPKDGFAVHTYEGPRDPARRPEHPVDGLRPHEADGLVDQLGALTAVDHRPLDPVAEKTDFHGGLCEQLVTLVAGLPRESQQLARFLGLPDAPRLREILARQRVSRRTPALLHGDLNPWNLVRRDDRLALTLIDWEMALVGDPLYDLVRHMHLTPTKPDIRDRMFRRWERTLPAEYTGNWRRDSHVYRWIELVRSAYVDLDRLVTGAGLDAPNVRRAVDSYAMTLAAATASLGLPVRRGANPYRAWGPA
ncbi:phosphotransferase family protein [Streptomyces sp. NPDC086787]|uniref:phosphotransferase family protein n=1 Tax=Streptomyces sp. NPDC086787 TaxID=3365759 RepID=UPI003802022D